jgi:hypothetical protein
MPVHDFNVVNLCVRNAVEATGVSQDIALALNANNALDAEPPVYAVNRMLG